MLQDEDGVRVAALVGHQAGREQYVECRAYWHSSCQGIASLPLVFEENFQCRDIVERGKHHGWFKPLMCVYLVRQQQWSEDVEQG